MAYSYERTIEADTDPGSTLRNTAHTLQGVAREMGRVRYTLQGLKAQLDLTARSTHDHQVQKNHAGLTALVVTYEKVLRDLNELAKDADDLGRHYR